MPSRMYSTKSLPLMNASKKLESDLQSAGKPADEKLIEFKFYFQETKANLKKFIGVLNSIDDAEKRAKFRSAAIKFVVGIEAELEKNETEGAGQ